MWLGLDSRGPGRRGIGPRRVGSERVAARGREGGRSQRRRRDEGGVHMCGGGGLWDFGTGPACDVCIVYCVLCIACEALGGQARGVTLSLFLT